MKLLPVLALFLCGVLQAHQWDLSSGTKSEVEFVVLAQPGSLKIRGKTEKGVSGSVHHDGNEIKLTANLELATLDTGISLRDRHLKEKYLEVEKFPRSELVAIFKTDGQVPIAFKDKAFRGVLKLHGVEKPVSGECDLSIENGNLKGTFFFDLKLSDFGISQPSFMGVKVDETVNVKAQVAGNSPT